MRRLFLSFLLPSSAQNNETFKQIKSFCFQSQNNSNWVLLVIALSTHFLYFYILGMVNREEIKLRQLIFAEYRAKSDKKQALANIITKLGSDSVSESTIDHWYREFKADNIVLSDEGSEHYDIVPAIQMLSNGEEVSVLLDLKSRFDFILERHR
jgi:hypothetical protein